MVSNKKEKRVTNRLDTFKNVQQWGVDIRDPLGVRDPDQQLSEDEIIMTHPDYRNRKGKAVRQIQRTFENSKNVKVGYKKPENPGVFAEQVYDFVPFPQIFSNTLQLVAFDGNLQEEDIGKSTVENNDFLLLKTLSVD